MSQDAVEIIGRSLELWLRGDLEAWLETIDPEVGSGNRCRSAGEASGWIGGPVIARRRQLQLRR